jgi:predicted metal-binding protein
MTTPSCTIFVCISCGRRMDEAAIISEGPGPKFLEALTRSLPEKGDVRLEARPVECLAVCKRPCTVAFAAEGKWTYIVGDLDEAIHIGDVISAALSYAASENGIVPWKERPPSFRKGVVARVPPLPLTANEREEAA